MIRMYCNNLLKTMRLRKLSTYPRGVSIGSQVCDVLGSVIFLCHIQNLDDSHIST